jgi:hypothetical protein
MALPPVFDGCSIADGDKPVRQGGLVRARVSNGGFLILHRGGPHSVSIGEFEETVAQIRVDGTAGEAAATLGLLAKM